MTKITIEKNTATVEGGGSVAKLLMGCKGKIKVKTPYGEREIKVVEKENNGT